MGSDVTFALVPGTRLYWVPGTAGGPWPLYLLPDDGTTPPATLDFASSWSRLGCYVFTPQPVTPTSGLAAAIAARAATAQPARFMWISDVEARPLAGPVVSASAQTVVRDGPIALRNITLCIANQTTLELDQGAGAPAAAFVGNQYAGPYFQSGPGAQRSTVARVAVDLWGGGMGVLRFQAPLGPQALARFGGDVRFFVAQPHVKPLPVRFPLLPFSQTGALLTLDSSIDFFAPLDSERTRFALPAGSYASYLSTPSGNPVVIQPASAGAGFALSSAPDPSAPDGGAFYLAPAGEFTATPEGDGVARVGCGLAAVERLSLDAGARIVFTPNQPAYAVPPEDRGATGPWLVDTTADKLPATTAWAGVAGGPGAGYHAQARHAVLFGAPVDGASGFVGPNDVLVRPAAVDPETTGATPSFPLALFAGVDAQAAGTPINPQVDAGQVTDLESSAIQPQRSACLPAPAYGPRVVGALVPRGRHMRRGLRRTLAAAPKTAQAAPGYAITPGGLVVRVDTNGALTQLVLAREPGTAGTDAKDFLSIGDGQAALDSKLAGTLMSPELFLVVSQSDRLGQTQLSLEMDGFTFDLAPRASNDPDGIVGILVLKYGPGRLVDLVNDPSSWSALADFNGNKVVPLLQGLVNSAVADKDALLAAFRTLAMDPGWRGTIAFNGGIGPDGLPTELQGLRGGMSGPLRAHHMASPASHVDPAKPLATLGSSFDGVIRYVASGPPPAPPKPEDPSYTVRRLGVGFTSSAISAFNARVWMTTPQLFGRDVTTQAQSNGELPPDTLEVDGSYQRHDGQGTFKFASKGTTEFAITRPPDTDRILHSVGVTSATFTTLSAAPDKDQPTKLKVTARLSMSGALTFDPSPFGGAPGLDMFGYHPGDGGKPLEFDGLDMDIGFLLPPGDDSTAQNLAVAIVPRLKFSTATPASAAAGSALGSMPLSPTTFLTDAVGLSSAKLGGQTVFTPQLSERASKEPSSLAGALSTPTLTAGRTGAPQYAIQYSLPLGTLGALSSVHVGLVATVALGWGPSPTDPDQDAFGIFVSLPQLIPGFRGMNVQGILKTSFGTANLLLFDTPKQYVLSFSNVSLNLVALKLPPGYMVDLLVFGDPRAGWSASRGNVGWVMAATPDMPPPTPPKPPARELEEAAS